ncbi:mitochondrial inner membrane protease subunit-like protein [Xylariomycetidae sp. FL0641]|nr:mitochondrial inner membrane protease subunit-like protein [Xylariomycetidae sp. FL0641]
MAARAIWTRLKQRQVQTARAGLYLFGIATWLPVIISFNDYVGEVTWIEGNSMYPFFNAEKNETTRQDIVLNFKYNAQYGLRRGMIVTLWHPYDPEKTAVKRVIGLPGDVVRTRDPYPVPTVRIPPGHVWVEGDGGPRESRDSNTYGPVSTGLIIGKVTHILWPWHRAGKVRWWEWAERIRQYG